MHFSILLCTGTITGTSDFPGVRSTSSSVPGGVRGIRGNLYLDYILVLAKTNQLVCQHSFETTMGRRFQTQRQEVQIESVSGVPVPGTGVEYHTARSSPSTKKTESNQIINHHHGEKAGDQNEGLHDVSVNSDPSGAVTCLSDSVLPIKPCN